MTFLLDVNVLIALIDVAHINHDAAHRWFDKIGSAAWATCPLTENGVLRIVGHHRYINTPGSPATVAPVLAHLCALPGHRFWADDISLLDTTLIDTDRLSVSSDLTDIYLLALAVRHGGMFATFDSRVIVNAVHGGKRALHRIAAQPEIDRRPQ